MKVINWTMKDVSKNTAYIWFSMTGQNANFNSILNNINKLGLKKISGVEYSYFSDEGKLEGYKNKVYIDKKQQINFYIKDKNLQIIIGEFILNIKDFDTKSKNMNLKKLSLAITNEVVSPSMYVSPWESLEFIVIKGIEK